MVGKRPADDAERGTMTPMPDPGDIQRRRVLSAIDGAAFLFAGVAVVWLAFLLLRASLQPGWPLLLLLVFWLMVAYLLLPRLHRILTRLYLPGYFIGRARTSDGLLGDPVNLALRGNAAQIHATMSAAGWTRADDVDLRSSLRIVSSTLTRKTYAEAPVSPLHLFDQQQDFAYQQEVAGNPAKRHHVRFWQAPSDWYLPGGFSVDWLAAGTFDRSVGLSYMTFQVTHRIAADIDTERDYIVESLTSADAAVEVEVIRNFSSGYHSRNGGGDSFKTDGHLPVVDLTAVMTSPALEDEAVRSSAELGRRPPPTTFGGGVALLSGGLYLLVGILLVVAPGWVDTVGHRIADAVSGEQPFASLTLFLAATVDLVLGVAILRGSAWARLVLIVISGVTILGAMIADFSGADAPTMQAGLPAISLSILTLLALSSRRSREYAERRRDLTHAATGAPEVAEAGVAPTAK